MCRAQPALPASLDVGIVAGACSGAALIHVEFQGNLAMPSVSDTWIKPLHLHLQR